MAAASNAEKVYRVRVAFTQRISERGLRGLWRYWNPAEPFSLRKAMALARERLSENESVASQIEEGLESLEKEEEADG